MTVECVYQGSDGNYYTDWQVERNLRIGIWEPCLVETETKRRLVEIGVGELVFLLPIDPESLPSWAEVRSDGVRIRIVDTRRAAP